MDSMGFNEIQWIFQWDGKYLSNKYFAGMKSHNSTLFWGPFEHDGTKC